jgi:hypothetical protein
VPGATTVDELKQPEDADIWRHIPARTLRVQESATSGSNGDHLVRVGYVVKNSRHAVIAIARSLRPVP